MNKRANRRLVIESTSARSSLASNDSDERSSTGSGSLAGRRRAGGVRRGVNGAPVEKYSPNKNTFGGVGVSQRSLRLLGKSQNQTSSSALRLSDSASDDGNSNRGSHSSARLRKMQRESDQQESDQRESQYWEYPQHEQDGYNDGYDHHRPQQYSPHGQVGSPHGHPPHHQHHQYPPSPQYQYPPSPQYQYPPQSYAPPPQQQADPFQAYLIQQHNMAEIQRQEDKHKAEHERHMAETSMIQQQQKELEKKNALLEQEMRDMQQQEARRRQLEDDEVRRQEQEELQRLRKAERDREARVLPHPAPFASSPSALSDSRLDPPHESFLSNEQLLAEITVLKRAISASSRNQSSDDELLSMFTRLQVLQDVLEKRDVEIDAAQLLARSFRRQSSVDAGPTRTLVRSQSSTGEEPPASARNSFSRRCSHDERKSFSKQNSIDDIKSLCRQNSIDDKTSINRRSSINDKINRRNSVDDKKSLSRQNSLTAINKTLDRLCSSDSIQSRNLSRQASMEEPLDDEDLDIDDVYGQEGAQEEVQVVEDPRVTKLQEEISLLSSNILSKSFSDNTLLVMFDQLDDLKLELAVLKGIDLQSEVDCKFDEAAELQVNPQFSEIKKLKPVLRRLLPMRTQFAKIEELFNCDVEKESVDEDDQRASAQFSLDMIGEEYNSEEDSDGDDDYDFSDDDDVDFATIHNKDVVNPQQYNITLDVIGEEEESTDDDEEKEIKDVVVKHPASSSGENSPSERQLSMEGRGEMASRRRQKSDFMMGNPMTSPRSSMDGEHRDSTDSSTDSINSMDRLPKGVNVFRKPSLDIFQSKRK